MMLVYWNALVRCRGKHDTYTHTPSPDPGNSLPVRGARFGYPLNYPILLDDLVCSGGEETLLECPRGYRSGEMLVERELGDSDCSHEEDAGVRCNGESVSVKATAPTSNMHPAIIMLCKFSISFPDFVKQLVGF